MHLSALQRSVIDPEALREGNFLNDFVIFLLLCNQLNTIHMQLCVVKGRDPIDPICDIYWFSFLILFVLLGVILFSKYETPQSRRYLSSFLFIVSIMEYDIFERSGVAQNVEKNFFFPLLERLQIIRQLTCFLTSRSSFSDEFNLRHKSDKSSCSKELTLR